MSKSTVCIRCLATKIIHDVWGDICPNCHPQGPNYKPLTAAPTAIDNRIRTYTVDDVAKFLNVCRRSVFNLLKSGSLPRVKVGQRTVIRDADLIAFIQRGGSQL
jgi:excisionase family DNA binding protein